jgi:hypothetical protein
MRVTTLRNQRCSRSQIIAIRINTKSNRVELSLHPVATSFLLIVLGLSNRIELTLRVLRRLAGSFESDLLALFNAGVPRQQSGLLDHRAQLFVETAERAGDAMTSSFCLAGAATANDANMHIKSLSSVRQAKRLKQLELMNRTTPKIILGGLAIDSDHARARIEPYARHCFFSATDAEMISRLFHGIPHRVVPLAVSAPERQ